MENLKTEFGKKLTPVLESISDGIWEFESYELGQPNYDDVALEYASKIFISVMMDKIWNLQQEEDMPMEERMKMVIKCGEDIKKIIKTYTDMDSHDFFKDN